MSRRLIQIGVLSLLMIGSMRGSAVGQSQPPRTQQQQLTESLKLITDAADKICGVVVAAGEAQSVKVSGDVKAQLNALARKLADLGLSGTGEFATDSYVGMLRTDLATTLKDQRDCKSKIFDKLSDKVINIGDTLPQPISFQALGPQITFGCEQGGVSEVSYNAPPGYRIINAFVEPFQTDGTKTMTPKITRQEPRIVEANIYFMGRDRNMVRDCPGGGHGQIRLYGTIQQE